MKNNVLHPYFLESQPEKAEKEIFFIGSDKTFFDKKNRPIKSVKIWVQQVLYREN